MWPSSSTSSEARPRLCGKPLIGNTFRLRYACRRRVHSMADTSSPPSPSRLTTAPTQPPSGHHVFISYAYEDKKVARALARQLKRLGLRVWFDETEITVGDSLRAVIDRGLQ